MDTDKKLRVVGWIDMDDFRFSFIDDVSDEMYDAIVDEVRGNGYYFGGDDHERHPACCPLLSNGYKVEFSWRGWGGVIATAYGEYEKGGPYAYMVAYMTQLIEPKRLKYPAAGIDLNAVDAWREEPRHVKLPASQIHWAVKLYDFRPYDEFAKTVKRFNRIEYEKEHSEGMSLKSVLLVTDIIVQEDFEKLYDYVNDRTYMSMDSELLGYDSDLTREELMNALYADYPKEQIKKTGAVCFKLWIAPDDGKLD